MKHWVRKKDFNFSRIQPFFGFYSGFYLYERVNLAEMLIRKINVEFNVWQAYRRFRDGMA